MPKTSIPESHPEPAAEAEQSFEDIFQQYERTRARKREEFGQQVEGTVVAVSSDSVFLDIGFKSEGTLSLAEFQSAGQAVQPGDRLMVSVKGRDLDGYYQLSRGKIAQVRNWASLEEAFASGTPIAGTVSGLVKGGLSVDVGVRAFMPASRSGARDPEELQKLVGQQIRCRIIKLDSAEEDLVVDRRVVLEQEEQSLKERRYSEIREGAVLTGVVRSLADYGAFIDLGGVDALLHVSDIAWSRVDKPGDLLSPGQSIEVEVLKITSESGKRRISVGRKQLQPHPWDTAPGKYKLGDRVRGTVTRVMEFGAFVELEPGIEGLIHVSEMSWAKKVKIASEVVKPGETVEAVILALKPEQRRISLGLKQTLGDPWAEVPERFPPGTVIEAQVTSIKGFGAFLQVAEGVEGMIHISEITDKPLHHPQELLRVGQSVRVQVIAVDRQKRQLRLGMKQLIPTSVDEYLSEHQEGDAAEGRILEIAGETVRVELGEGIEGVYRIAPSVPGGRPEFAGSPQPASKPDLASLSSLLQARWKGSAGTGGSRPDALRAGQVRGFRISKLDRAAKKIELELPPIGTA